ncbi:hypothetical protein AAES_113447 [Amazona aestiva]|uniref:Uncharacterized protein n=1 Tax=Amazona aestiva TaxID=12930 RepID=A0A0Q3PD73_AMAAE|nr:hypothetical protein AAES_113447 [Amazona aestiva]
MQLWLAVGNEEAEAVQELKQKPPGPVRDTFACAFLLLMTEFLFDPVYKLPKIENNPNFSALGRKIKPYKDIQQLLWGASNMEECGMKEELVEKKEKLLVDAPSDEMKVLLAFAGSPSSGTRTTHSLDFLPLAWVMFKSELCCSLRHLAKLLLGFVPYLL